MSNRDQVNATPSCQERWAPIRPPEVSQLLRDPACIVPVLVLVLLTALILSALSVSTAALKSGPTAKAASSSIAIRPDGSVLLAVNPDSNSVTLVDTATQAVLAEIAVGVDPRSVAVAPDGQRAYVANQASDTVSILDVDSATAIADVAVGYRPVGVAVSPDGQVVAVAELGDDQVRLLDAATASTRAVVAVADRPCGLAFTPDGGYLLVTHLLSGEVTVILLSPFRVYLPLILKGDTTGLPTAVDARQVPGRAPSGSVTVTTWPQVAPAPAVVVNAAGTRGYLPQTMAHGLGLNTQFDNTVFPKVSVLNLSTLAHETAEHISLPEKDQPVGLPWDAALTNDDRELWVVNAASNDVSVLDISDPRAVRRTAHIPVADNPRGIVMHPDGGMAYVNNTLAGTVSVIDTGQYTVTAVITVTEIPLPPVLLHGKRLFHSSALPELSQARWISCNTCHIEGEHDGRTWLLQYTGEVPPGATAVITRNTTSLLGMIETYPLRWSAEWDESADSEFSVRFEQFGTGLIAGEMNPTLGAPNQGRSWDLDCLASYIDSLEVGGGRTSPPAPLLTTKQMSSGEGSRNVTAGLTLPAGAVQMSSREGSGNVTAGLTLPAGAVRMSSGEGSGNVTAGLTLPAGAVQTSGGERAAEGDPEQGRELFLSARTGCSLCHPAPLYTDQRQHDVGTAGSYGEWFGPRIDTPSLRFVYDSAPYLHDGSAATLLDVLTTANADDQHGVTSHLTAQELDDLVAYMLELPYPVEDEPFTYASSTCLSQPTRGPARIEIRVEGRDIVMAHHGAIYNCCAQMVIYLEARSPLFKLVEQEEYPDSEPCRCLCPYQLGARIANLPPGTYGVQVWDGTTDTLLAEERVTVQ